jgi:hypothetical protein
MTHVGLPITPVRSLTPAHVASTRRDRYPVRVNQFVARGTVYEGRLVWVRWPPPRRESFQQRRRPDDMTLPDVRVEPFRFDRLHRGGRTCEGFGPDEAEFGTPGYDVGNLLEDGPAVAQVAMIRRADSLSRGALDGIRWDVDARTMDRSRRPVGRPVQSPSCSAGAEWSAASANSTVEPSARQASSACLAAIPARCATRERPTPTLSSTSTDSRTWSIASR